MDADTGTCGGIAQLDCRVLQWVQHYNIPTGLYKHNYKLATWSVLVSEDRQDVFSSACAGKLPPLPGLPCCAECASMWQCVTTADSKGSSKPQFYRHVLNLVRNIKLNKSVQDLHDRAYLKRCSMVAPIEHPVVRCLKKRWSGLNARDQDILRDTVHNIGREGKQKCGSRWSCASKAQCLRLNLTVGWRQLSSMCCPSRSTINLVLDEKFRPVGLQAKCYESHGGYFKSAEVTLSGDDLSLNGALDVITTVEGGVAKHTIVGNANALQTCKHGLPVTYSFSEVANAPPKASIPIASNVLIHVIHTPTDASPIVVAHLFPHNGLELEDYLFVLHSIEQICPVSNVGYDNYSCQLQVKSGVLRPFCKEELVWLAQQRDDIGDTPELVKIANVAVALARPVGIVLHQYRLLCATQQDGSVHPPALPIPYPYVTNYSAVSCKHQAISPEYRHTIRLWVKHFRDKRSRLIIWDFTTYSALSFMDVYSLYISLPTCETGLRFQCIDQSDSTLNNERAYELHTFKLVRCVLQNVYYGQSTALHLLVGSAYLHIFRGGVCKLAGIVLAHFCSSAVVCQRVQCLRSKGLTLASHSYTSPTAVAMLQDCAGFIYMCLKGNGGRPFHPQHCGEWQNESLNAKLRCPGTMQFTSNVSMLQVMQRLSRIEMVDRLESNGESACNGESELVGSDVHIAMLLGWDLWCKVAAEYGMGDIVKKFPSYALLFKEHLRLAKPDVSSVITYREWIAYIDALNHKVENPATYNLSAAMGIYANELSEFFATVDLLLDRSKHMHSHVCKRESVQATVDDTMQDACDTLPVAFDAVTTASDAVPSGCDPKHYLAIRSFVAQHYNGDLRGQNRNLLGRYATQDQVRGNAMSTAQDPENSISVGKTYAFVFNVQRESLVKGRKVVNDELEVYIGLMRNIVAAPKAGAKGRKSLMRVDGQDTSAVYYACPYAKVSLGYARRKQVVMFEIVHQDVPKYYGISKGCAVRNLAEGEDTDDETATSKQLVTGDSNLREEVNVDWLPSGPVVLDDTAMAVLKKRVKEPLRECA